MVKTRKEKIDPDLILTPYEKRLIKESYEEEKRGEFITHEELKKKLKN